MGKLINISFLKSKKHYIDIDAIISVQPEESSYYDKDNKKHSNILYRIELINNEEYVLPTEIGERILRTKGLIDYE